MPPSAARELPLADVEVPCYDENWLRPREASGTAMAVEEGKMGRFDDGPSDAQIVLRPCSADAPGSVDDALAP